MNDEQENNLNNFTVKNIVKNLLDTADIQRQYLPAPLNKDSGLRLAYYYLPAEIVSGDMIVLSPLSQGGYALMIADAMGHGISAAMIASNARLSFIRQINASPDPSAWAEGMARDLRLNLFTGQFITAFFAKIDPKAGKLTYVMAGHQPPILLHQGAKDGPLGDKPWPALLNATGEAIGCFDNPAFSSQDIPFSPGDRLVMFTDGLVEELSANTIRLSDQGLMKLCVNLPMDTVASAQELLKRVRDFQGNTHFSDDATLLILDRIEESST